MITLESYYGALKLSLDLLEKIKEVLIDLRFKFERYSPNIMSKII